MKSGPSGPSTLLTTTTSAACAAVASAITMTSSAPALMTGFLRNRTSCASQRWRSSWQAPDDAMQRPAHVALARRIAPGALEIGAHALDRIATVRALPGLARGPRPHEVEQVVEPHVRFGLERGPGHPLERELDAAI